MLQSSAHYTFAIFSIGVAFFSLTTGGGVQGFVPVLREHPPHWTSGRIGTAPRTRSLSQSLHLIDTRSRQIRRKRPSCSAEHGLWSAFDNEFETQDDDDSEEDDDEDDEEAYLNADALGDWRIIRKNLAMSNEDSSSSSSTTCEENEALLRTQCEQLATEYGTGAWAHTAPSPEVGGLVVRMPLEAEIFRNHKHSLIGRTFRAKFGLSGTEAPSVWYEKARRSVELDMLSIAKSAGSDGQIDASTLDNESAELLHLYLDNQETWQEVCLVLEHDLASKTATTLVLNRPMALKLTENLAQLVLYGAFQTLPRKRKGDATTKVDLIKFMLAFGSECAVYIGGPDDQDQPAEILHGIADLPGAREICPGSRIYCGGLDAAVRGVLQGKYKPMDFRFFVGRHNYDESDTVELAVVLGKYQPIACARTLVLKQCISLPTPLWHEVLELCGGEMKALSQLEYAKRHDLRLDIISDSSDELDSDDEIIDELNELERFDDEEDEGFY